ncbi:hypothetical protein BKA62DRAFT_765789 [Auriculariales sp. MPI-PUGE-AT-0066]|nr:hypothetical protein BKA62DRAFT_765789 [Auriculariales sp. MPI-PUGE-AT-0066]
MNRRLPNSTQYTTRLPPLKSLSEDQDFHVHGPPPAYSALDPSTMNHALYRSTHLHPMPQPMPTSHGFPDSGPFEPATGAYPVRTSTSPASSNATPSPSRSHHGDSGFQHPPRSSGYDTRGFAPATASLSSGSAGPGSLPSNEPSHWYRIPAHQPSLSIHQQMDLLAGPAHALHHHLVPPLQSLALPTPTDNTPAYILSKIVSNCTELSEFAERYDVIPDGLPDDDFDSMAQMAMAVVTLIETLHRVTLGDEPLPPFQDEAVVEREAQNDHDMATIREKRMAQLAAQANSANPRTQQIKSKPRKKTRAAPPEKCQACYNNETPEWRRGPFGSRTLCNACGIHYAKIMSRRVLGVEVDPEKEMTELRATVQLPPADGSAPRPRRMRRVANAALKKDPNESGYKDRIVESIGHRPVLNQLGQPTADPTRASSLGGGVPVSGEILQHGHASTSHLVSPTAMTSAHGDGRPYTVHGIYRHRAPSQQISFAEAGSSLLHAPGPDLHARRSLSSGFEHPQAQPTFHPTHQQPEHIDPYSQQHQVHSPIHAHAVAPLHPGGPQDASVTRGVIAGDYYTHSAPVHYAHPGSYASHGMATTSQPHHATGGHTSHDMHAHTHPTGVREPAHHLQQAHGVLGYTSQHISETVTDHGMIYYSPTTHHDPHMGPATSHAHLHGHADAHGSR